MIENEQYDEIFSYLNEDELIQNVVEYCEFQLREDNLYIKIPLAGYDVSEIECLVNHDNIEIKVNAIPSKYHTQILKTMFDNTIDIPLNSGVVIVDSLYSNGLLVIQLKKSTTKPYTLKIHDISS